MTDPVTTRSTRPPDAPGDAERDAKIDELLLGGLDHYFAGRLQEAINVWGRVLFLDRSHARARAYIERARSALAERQRKAEELLHDGVAAFQRGDGNSARRLLTSSVEQGGPQDVALAYLGRLERLEGTSAAQDPAANEPRPPAVRRRRRAERLFRHRPATPIRVWPLVAMAVAVTVIMLFAASSDLFGPLLSVDLRWRGTPSAAASAGPLEPLPVPRSAEAILGRARVLSASGRLKEALALLELVPSGDLLEAEALRLRADIQRSLLDSEDTTRPPQGPLRPGSTEPGRGGAGRE